MIGRCCLRELEAYNDRPDILSMILGGVFGFAALYYIVVLILV